MTVMSVDDSKVVKSILSLLLKPLGNPELIAQDNLEDALQTLSHRQQSGRPVDLILTGLRCRGLPIAPGTAPLGGFQLVQIVRGNVLDPALSMISSLFPQAGRRIPILVLTSENDPVLTDQVKAAGASAVLNKTFYFHAANQASFREVVKSHLHPLAACATAS